MRCFTVAPTVRFSMELLHSRCLGSSGTYLCIKVAEGELPSLPLVWGGGEASSGTWVCSWSLPMLWYPDAEPLLALLQP